MTELAELFSRPQLLSWPMTASSFTLFNTLSTLDEEMWTSWIMSAWRACFPRGAE